MEQTKDNKIVLLGGIEEAAGRYRAVIDSEYWENGKKLRTDRHAAKKWHKVHRDAMLEMKGLLEEMEKKMPNLDWKKDQIQ